MANILKGKTIVLGVTGSIAAYKAIDLASLLTQAGATVKVVMTKSATEFVAPINFRSLTRQPVTVEMWDLQSDYPVQHVQLAEAADAVLIAPATANIIAKLANGIADDELTCTVLATKAPVVIAPAMNVNMWENPVTQANAARLKERGFIFAGPGMGRLATGRVGYGRFLPVEQIIGHLRQTLGRKGDLSGRRIVITTGGTEEPIDPVRYISNRSSGKMGYALAEAARDRGAQVTLVTAPTHLDPPAGVKVIDVFTARDMYEATRLGVQKADALIMAAAVADFRPVKASPQKIKRQKATSLTLELERTVDILGSVKGDFLRVGFAAESTGLEANVKEKLARKKLDLIIGNDISAPGTGFGSDNNQVIILDRDGKLERTALLPKADIADRILDRVARLLNK
jgi:phosphopantothenoylcysteine decarboxylase/phosphopantothenate--cysteine ligase